MYELIKEMEKLGYRFENFGDLNENHFIKKANSINDDEIIIDIKKDWVCKFFLSYENGTINIYNFLFKELEIIYKIMKLLRGDK